MLIHNSELILILQATSIKEFFKRYDNKIFYIEKEVRNMCISKLYSEDTCQDIDDDESTKIKTKVSLFRQNSLELHIK